MEEKRYVLSILVKNTAGALMRLVSLISRRGFNIDDLSVGATTDTSYSRMTIVVRGDEYILNQITLQLAKNPDVKGITHLEKDTAIFRELMLIKVNNTFENRSAIIEIVNVFRGKIVDFSSNSLTIEIAGDSQKNNAFLELLIPYNVIEIARTGLTALERGEKSIYDYCGECGE